ncbi:hypothetical protein VC83_04241 [Pseudogymnoascus destructans]|uniref:RRM domain-containing protein n=2 Tax=Pseudogymnoascus destructans TaxID=655981 RepID=L8G0H7_PSED2|nr:uncharacterized protein VC83_04241 [Pseudogymnoascus destructans]ELR06775.1 hypothetical protein GMDG_02213 [Pseudogymnoascus destructans 20631-21]OAF59182.2 hypothetical protein VC83_04241 [Pseudogymnoascus destructans]
MGKPRMIILIRHAQSEGNKNRDIHQNIPDHRVKLTNDGWDQAHEAGRQLRALLKPDDTLHFFTSPYRRTRETTEGILSTLTSDDPSPSSFPRDKIKVYEEPRLREQDFGNFQPCSAEMERMWQERADYGHFFYRIPNGESAADAYDRVSGFNESLWRQFGEDDFASVCVLVTHGLMSRVFLMKWYHFSVEYFEDLRNVNHCEFLIMRKDEDSGRFILENKLRTWSELARERLLKEKSEKELAEEKASMDAIPSPMSETNGGVAGMKPGDLPPTPTVPKRKQWGGCPNGCDHGRFYYRRENGVASHSSSTNLAEAPPVRRAFHKRFQSSSEEDEDDPRGRLSNPSKSDSKSSSEENGTGKVAGIQRSLDSMLLSEPTEAFVTDKQTAHRAKPRDKAVGAVLHAGRDFGGSASGNTSRATSDAEAEADTEGLGREGDSGRRRTKSKREKKERGYKDSGMGRGARANTLGDQSQEEEACANCGSVTGNGNHQRRKDRASARAQTSSGDENAETDALFIGNIEAGHTEETLGAAFNAHGTVVNVRIPTNRDTGNLKGYGYITFSSVAEAKSALETMKGFDGNQQPLHVEYATRQQALEAGGGDGGECVDGGCKRDVESEEENDREEKSVHGSVY